MKRFISVFLLLLMVLIMLSSSCNRDDGSTSGEFKIKKDKISFQDRYSLDWDSCDAEYMCKLSSYKGGSVDDNLYNMLVTLYRTFDNTYPMSIPQVVINEFDLMGVTEEEISDIEIKDTTREAYDMLIYDRIDNCYGNLDYRN